MIARDGCENRGLWAGESCARRGGGGEDRAHSLEGQLEGKVSIGMLDREGVEVLSHRERSWLFFSIQRSVVESKARLGERVPRT